MKFREELHGLELVHTAAVKAEGELHSLGRLELHIVREGLIAYGLDVVEEVGGVNHHIHRGLGVVKGEEGVGVSDGECLNYSMRLELVNVDLCSGDAFGEGLS